MHEWKSDDKSTIDIMMMVSKTSPSMLAFSQSSKKEKKTAVDGDVLKAIKDAGDIAVNNLTVAAAKVTCTQAGGTDDFLHMVNDNGTNMDLSGLSTLTKTDIQMTNNNQFKKCKKRINKKCSGAEIVDKEWKLTSGTNEVAAGLDNPYTEKSCMVCIEGGAIYFLSSGQKLEDFEARIKGYSYEYQNIKEYAKKWDIDYDSVRWKLTDALYWKLKGGDQFIHENKLNFIAQYKEVIKDAAVRYDLPELLIAGIVYGEYGGDPMFADKVIYPIRSLDWSGPDWIDDNLTIAKNPDFTSFGDVSIQVRRACESLGYKDGDVSSQLKSDIIDSLLDPVENIYISSKHISDLQDNEYAGKMGSELSENDLIIIATRYNRGSDMNREKLEKNTAYGKRIIDNKDDIMGALCIED